MLLLVPNFSPEDLGESPGPGGQQRLLARMLCGGQYIRNNGSPKVRHSKGKWILSQAKQYEIKRKNFIERQRILDDPKPEKVD